MSPNELMRSLLEDRSSENRDAWAIRMADEQIDLRDYLDLLWEEHPGGMRFTWVLGDLVDRAPTLIFPVLPEFFAARTELNFPGYDRSLSKWFSICGIPEEIEGEVADQLFEWVTDPQIKVAVKVHSISALAKLTQKYPELVSELRLVIEEQLPLTSVGFKSRARKVLAQLDRQHGPG